MIFLIFLFFQTVLAGTFDGSCMRADNDTCYQRFFLMPMNSRFDAIDACKAWHPSANLPHITSLSVNKLVYGLCRTSWIGLARTAPKTFSFIWLDTNEMLLQSDYQSWNVGEPNDYDFANQTEWSVHFDNSELWNDIPNYFQAEVNAWPVCVVCQLANYSKWRVAAMTTTSVTTTKLPTPSSTTTTTTPTTTPRPTTVVSSTATSATITQATTTQTPTTPTTTEVVSLQTTGAPTDSSLSTVSSNTVMLTLPPSDSAEKTVRVSSTIATSVGDVGSTTVDGMASTTNNKALIADPLPLAIGVGCAVVFVLCVIAVVLFIVGRRARNNKSTTPTTQSLEPVAAVPSSFVPQQQPQQPNNQYGNVSSLRRGAVELGTMSSGATAHTGSSSSAYSNITPLGSAPQRYGAAEFVSARVDEGGGLLYSHLPTS